MRRLILAAVVGVRAAGAWAQGHVMPRVGELCAVREGVTSYFSPTEWEKVADKDGYDKKGIYMAGRGQKFIVALNDNGKAITWEEAMVEYGSLLPDKAKAEIMARNFEVLNEAIATFGGDEDPGFWYWTKTEDAEDPFGAWGVAMPYGYMYCYGKHNKLRVRGVSPLPGKVK